MTHIRRFTCIQCGALRNNIDMDIPRLPDGRFAHGTRVCADTGACRDRWWAEVAYQLGVA